ncbi:NACHT, LRR and PYD domains-containing protein 10-like [Brienomyrus brachyistius]|uniref:NACHT, LRR and PYD domains-containing protein 10-like n=1 Tax=Brienomyrus brachyistius TaxID=42636 RepID=UPI0020B264AA|nr:NACHT, LRR and PYD domains-containing protein 10-like [Brienomyrus brachyistius]
MDHHSHGETQTSLTDLLLDCLKDLSDDELKEFKLRLPENKELKPLPKGQMKTSGRTDFAEMMMNSYSKAGALKVTLEILKKMNLNDLAQRLKEALQKCNQAGSEQSDMLETS